MPQLSGKDARRVELCGRVRRAESRRNERAAFGPQNDRPAPPTAVNDLQPEANGTDDFFGRSQFGIFCTGPP